MTVQELYEWATINNCVDRQISINVTDVYHDSWENCGINLESLDKDNGECLNVEVKINEV